MKNLLILVAVGMSLKGFSQNVLTGTVTNVIDGNTIELVASDELYKIMLVGIDSPELAQDFGATAKTFMEKMILNKTVNVTFQGKDRWGNRLGIILIEGRTDPRYALLEAGLAWTAEHNPIPELEAIKDRALENSKGLWKEKNPTPPWVYRRQQTLTQFKSS